MVLQNRLETAQPIFEVESDCSGRFHAARQVDVFWVWKSRRTLLNRSNHDGCISLVELLAQFRRGGDAIGPEAR
jgi:hypothetical protein